MRRQAARQVLQRPPAPPQAPPLALARPQRPGVRPGRRLLRAGGRAADGCRGSWGRGFPPRRWAPSARTARPPGGARRPRRRVPRGWPPAPWAASAAHDGWRRCRWACGPAACPPARCGSHPGPSSDQLPEPPGRFPAWPVEKIHRVVTSNASPRRNAPPALIVGVPGFGGNERKSREARAAVTGKGEVEREVTGCAVAAQVGHSRSIFRFAVLSIQFLNHAPPWRRGNGRRSGRFQWLAQDCHP